LEDALAGTKEEQEDDVTDGNPGGDERCVARRTVRGTETMRGLLGP
jgi:hypothetical protein